MTLTIELPAELEAELQKAAHRQGKDIMQVLQDSIRQNLRHDILPQTESELLLTINSPLAPEARQRRDSLIALQQERSLTDAEREALIASVDALVMANAQRWQAIAELAERRGQSLAQIADQLEIPLP